MFVGHFKTFGKISKERSATNSSDYNTISYGEEGVEELSNLKTKLSRGSLQSLLSLYSTSTSLLILDYKYFKAARRIQAAWRGYYFRKLTHLRWKAAITIQRWWRGFQVRNARFKKIEDYLQEIMISLYNRAATKIQALYRGWWIRQTVHDMHSLRRLQICAAEDLLNCVAFKLHYLLRTYSIPGVYSLRNSHCLSRVEKLLATMTFRFHNDRVRGLLNRNISQKEYRRREFRSAQYNTPIPFAGPNFNRICTPQCEDFLKMDKDLDRRMYRIMAEYERAQAEAPVQNFKLKVKERNRRKFLEKILARQNKHKQNFCGDVIESMRKWKLWDGQNINICNELFRDPESLEKFIVEMGHLWDQIDQVNCYCKPKELPCR